MLYRCGKFTRIGFLGGSKVAGCRAGLSGVVAILPAVIWLGDGIGMSFEQVDECIELLCQRGCSAVRGVISDLEAGRPVPGTEQLSMDGRRRVLAELKAVMAVYDDRCPLPPVGG